MERESANRKKEAVVFVCGGTEGAERVAGKMEGRSKIDHGDQALSIFSKNYLSAGFFFFASPLEKMIAPSLAASTESICVAGTSPRCLAATAAAPPQLRRRRRRIHSLLPSPISVSNIPDRRQRSSFPSFLRRASTSDDVDALPIEGIPPRRGGECDDDVCTVSPAVEATVRSLGRDVARCAGQASFFASKDQDNKDSKKPRSTWNRVRFSPGVRYTDGFRTFVGVDGYEKLTWIRELLDRPDVVSLVFCFSFSGWSFSSSSSSSFFRFSHLQ